MRYITDMRILLLGEYSNVHCTLASSLKHMGHEVLLVSDGDSWKDYDRDVDLRRKRQGKIGSLLYMSDLVRLLPRLKGYDVVQIVNPVFLDVKARWNRMVFDFLKRHNGIVSVGCFGDDYFVVDEMSHSDKFDYTDMVAGHTILDNQLNRTRVANWLSEAKKSLCQHVMNEADCLMACLYEYYKVYDTDQFRSRLYYLPLPVNSVRELSRSSFSWPVRILVGIQTKRCDMKGTKAIIPLLERLASEFPDKISLDKIENLPFAEYVRRVDESDVVVDQLFSYTPAMNALQAMSMGKVVISGGEEDYYRFIGENEMRPIINLRPCDDDANYETLKRCLLDESVFVRMRDDSCRFVRKYHEASNVAQQYVDIWSSLLARKYDAR